MDKKTIIYNNTEVLRVEDAQTGYSTVAEGEYILVQTIPLAIIMLEARGISANLLRGK